MKSFRRVLAIALAMALLLSCAVAGLVLPASAETDTFKLAADEYYMAPSLSSSITVYGAVSALTPEGEDYTEELTWTSNNPDVVGISTSYAGVFYSKIGVEGSAVVTATNAAGEAHSCTVYVTFDGERLGGGDFESAASGVNMWTSKLIKDGAASIVEEENGNHVLHCPASMGIKYLVPVPIDRSKTYLLTFDYRGTVSKTQAGYLAATKTSNLDITVGTTTWKHFSLIFTSKSSGSREQMLGFRNNGTNGYLELDNISLIELGTAESIALNTAEAALNIGDELALTATPSPEGATMNRPVWSTDNDAVATVDKNGNVTAVGAGTATITATSHELTATCTVTVTDPNARPTTPTDPDALILNGDFEADAGIGWQNSAYIQEGVGKDGSWGIGFDYTHDGVGNKTLSVSYDDSTMKKLKPNTKYELSFDYRSTGAGFAQVYNYIDFSIDWKKAESVDLPDSKDWRSYSFTFTTKDTLPTSWSKLTFMFRYVMYGNASGTGTGSAAFDNIVLTEIPPITVVPSEELENGEITVDEAAEGVQQGDVVTVTVTPKEGYLMIPGSLRYTNKAGETVRVLNKDFEEDATFGQGDGNTFKMIMPDEKVTLTADFVSLEEQNFAGNTIGTACRYVWNDDELGYDGIRFLTRVNLANKFDTEAEELVVTYGGKEYTVLELGSLLKREENATALTYDNAVANEAATGANRMWISRAYTKDSGAFKLVDYTEGYIDFTSVMVTSHTERVYTARGYIRMQDAEGAVVTLEYDEISNSIESAMGL